MGKHKELAGIYAHDEWDSTLKSVSPSKAAIMTFCEECGLLLTPHTLKLACPPWSSASEGETTKAERHNGDGVVQELKVISVALDKAYELVNRSGPLLAKVRAPIAHARYALSTLIQKLEGPE